MTPSTRPIPRLPVFGWQTWAGDRQSPLPCILDLPNAHLTTSGRASILLALEALGIGAGMQVLLPTYHCPTMVAPAAQLGAVPRFYPIDRSGGADLEWLERQDLTSVRAILAAHYFGLPQPMAALRQWCDRHGIALIEDCAHALFGSSDGRPVGSWGNVSIGSLTKFLPVPEGGCLVLNRQHRVPELTQCSVKEQLKAWTDVLEQGARHDRLGAAGRLITTPLDILRSGAPAPAPAPVTEEGPLPNASPGYAVGSLTIDVPQAHRSLTQACRYLANTVPRHRIVERRRRHYQHLAHALSGLDGLQPLMPELPEDAAPYVFPVWVREPDPGYQQLRIERIPVFRWDWLWPGVPTITGDAGTRWSHHVIQLGCHQDLDEEDLDRIVATVRRQYSNAQAAGQQATLPTPRGLAPVR